MLIEICCGSLDDALLAAQAGADRIELNSCLMRGGLTPSLGTLVEAKRRIGIPVMAMVRPREAGFCYTEAEKDVMFRDAQLFVEHGADGIVFGCLNDDGTVDVRTAERIRKIIGVRDAVFHRAFDVVPDPFKALDALIELGVDRILTSGQEPTVYEGLSLIAELVRYAKGRIQILPGGGIAQRDVEAIISKTGIAQLHFASSAVRVDRSTTGNPRIFFGGAVYPPEDRFEIASLEIMQKFIGQARPQGGTTK